jgi:hypothetical protein
MRKHLKLMAAGAAAVFAVMQFYRPARTNPPSDPAATFYAMATPPIAVANAVRRACTDCHSNDTSWPWYSHIAPASWLISRDVRVGRAHLNLSEWNLLGPEMLRSRMAEMCREVRFSGMPPLYFTIPHPSKRLNTAETDALCAFASDSRQ